MKKVIIFVFIIAGVFFASKLIKNKKEQLEKSRTAYIHTYKPLEAEVSDEPKNIISFNALVEAKESPNITTKVSGYIQKIYVNENQNINKGDILVKIDNEEYLHNLLQLESSLAALKNSYLSLKSSIESLKLDTGYAFDQYNINQKLYNIGESQGCSWICLKSYMSRKKQKSTQAF